MICDQFLSELVGEGVNRWLTVTDERVLLPGVITVQYGGDVNISRSSRSLHRFMTLY